MRQHMMRQPKECGAASIRLAVQLLKLLSFITAPGMIDGRRVRSRAASRHPLQTHATAPRARRVRSPGASPGGPPNSNNPLTPPPPKGDSPGPMRDARHTPVASLSSPFEAAIAKRRGEVEFAVEEAKSV